MSSVLTVRSAGIKQVQYSGNLVGSDPVYCSKNRCTIKHLRAQKGSTFKHGSGLGRNYGRSRWQLIQRVVPRSIRSAQVQAVAVEGQQGNEDTSMVVQKESGIGERLWEGTFDLDPGGDDELAMPGLASMTEFLADKEVVEEVQGAVGTLTVVGVSTEVSQSRVASGSQNWMEVIESSDKPATLEVPSSLDYAIPGASLAVETLVPGRLKKLVQEDLEKAIPTVKLAAKVASGAVKGGMASAMAATVSGGGIVPGHLELAAMHGAIMGATVDLAGAVVDPAGKKAEEELLAKENVDAPSDCAVQKFIRLAHNVLKQPVSEADKDSWIKKAAESDETEEEPEQDEYSDIELTQSLLLARRLASEAISGKKVKAQVVEDAEGVSVSILELAGKALSGALKGAAAGAASEAASHGFVPLGAAQGAIGGAIGETAGTVVDPLAEGKGFAKQEERSAEKEPSKSSPNKNLHSKQDEGSLELPTQAFVKRGVQRKDLERTDEQQGERAVDAKRVMKVAGKALTGAIKGAAAGAANELASSGKVIGIGTAKAAIGTAVAEAMGELSEQSGEDRSTNDRNNKEESNIGDTATKKLLSKVS